MTRSLITAALAIAAVALGIVNVIRWRTPVEQGLPPPDAAARADPAPVSIRLRLEGRPLPTFPETAARPLFWQSRRPQPAPDKVAMAAPASPAAPAMAPAELRLAGIMVEGARRRRALLVSPQLSDGLWVEEGSEIEGWLLTRIESAAVRIEAGGREQLLELK